MTINNISSNNTAIRLQPVASKPNIETQTATKPVQNINNANQNSSLSPLSSRYTYAIGKDGKKYILQLRIDIASDRAFSALA